mmetsp:Transcript_39210/g.76566  ORF Transcript_39210/g.76566 Transcript_39210/m.76566 type:complete len:314 (-) Transcript_39210:233-1174(-)
MSVARHEAREGSFFRSFFIRIARLALKVRASRAMLKRALRPSQTEVGDRKEVDVVAQAEWTRSRRRSLPDVRWAWAGGGVKNGLGSVARGVTPRGSERLRFGGPRGGGDCTGGAGDGGGGGAPSDRVMEDIPLKRLRVGDDGGAVGGRRWSGATIFPSLVQNPPPKPASARAVPSVGDFCSRKVTALFWDLSGASTDGPDLVATDAIGAGALFFFFFSADFGRDGTDPCVTSVPTGTITGGSGATFEISGPGRGSGTRSPVAPSALPPPSSPGPGPPLPPSSKRAVPAGGCAATFDCFCCGGGEVPVSGMGFP